MNTCAECCFWDRSPFDYERGECKLTRWSDMDGHEHPKSKAKAQAGGHEPDSAALETASDFGCVQFEKRPVDLTKIPVGDGAVTVETNGLQSVIKPNIEGPWT